MSFSLSAADNVSFRRGRRSRRGLDLTPLIDVVFQLLVFFLLGSSFVPPALRIALPTARVRDPATSPAVTVSADAEGHIRVGASEVVLEGVEAAVRSGLQASATGDVRLNVDRAATYQVFVDLVEAARRAGARNLGIAHEVLR